MHNKLFMMIRGLDQQEFQYLKELTADFSEEELRTFAAIYNDKRRSSETILIATLVGFFAFAGIQRFLVGQIGMGILYVFTLGLCFIGTIVDLINHKELANGYNRQMAQETFYMVR